MKNKTKNKPQRRAVWRKMLLLFFSLWLTTIPAIAQNISVKGYVADNQNIPLVGVSVVQQGTANGTITNVDGEYTISVPSNSVLEFSYIGMSKQTVRVQSQTTINVIMIEDALLLEETVVIGYGTAKKQDLTGSIGRVSSETIMQQPSSNAVKAVQGKMAGVNVVASDSPGKAPVVVIRGLGTALGGRNPLYIIDGFPADNIQNINPSDIVSMDVLKDASSASIYGVRAANGVILVTTKKGKEGTSTISASSHIGIKTTLNRVEMANAQEYITYYNENQAMLGNHKSLALQQPYDTDWYDELLKNGLFTSNTVSLSGGGKTVDYFFSYNYYKEDGVLDGQGYNRSTIRNNNVYKFFESRLKITQHLNISFSNDDVKPFTAFSAAYSQSPLVPTRYSNGRYGIPFLNNVVTGQVPGTTDDIEVGTMWTPNTVGGTNGKLNSIGNPLMISDLANEREKTLTIQGGIEGEFALTDFLKVNSRFGATKYYKKNRQFSDLKTRYLNSEDATRTEEFFVAQKEANKSSKDWADNSLRLEDEETYRWMWEGYLTFNKDFGFHHVEAVAGLSAERMGIGSKTKMLAYDVPAKSQYWNIGMASDAYAKEIDQYSYTPRSLASYFGRVQYNFNHKYYFSGTIRRDGSSTFKSSGKHWGTFPSFGLGWTISEEPFMQTLRFLNYLKIRGTWGELGNQDIPINVSQMLADPDNSDYNYPFGSQAGYYQGAAFGTPATGVSWEVTRETSIGVDFAMFNQRLNGSFDYYSKTNTNTILSVNPLLDSEYSKAYYAHGAKVNNRGFEINLSWSDMIFGGLTYEIGMNYAYNKNRVKSVKTAYDGDTGGDMKNGQVVKRLMVGQPLYCWWLYEVEGVWQTQEEIDANPHLGSPAPGHLRYKDQNGDNVIDSRDRIAAGSYLPVSTYGIHLTAAYKNFDFGIDTYGVAGNKIYNGLKNSRIDGGENITKDTFKNRWTGEGSTNKHPGASRDVNSSTYYLESGSFFRINNITLGYTLKDVIVKGGKLRFYATAQNPFMFTGYSGFTPEITGSGVPKETAGIELDAYPTTRNFLFGVHLEF